MWRFRCSCRRSFLNSLMWPGPRHAKRARTAWHVISSNLHLKNKSKMAEALWYVHSRSDFCGFNCYFRTFITSIMLSGEWSGQKSLKLKMDKICRPRPFRMPRPTCVVQVVFQSFQRYIIRHHVVLGEIASLSFEEICALNYTWQTADPITNNSPSLPFPWIERQTLFIKMEKKRKGFQRVDG